LRSWWAIATAAAALAWVGPALAERPPGDRPPERVLSVSGNYLAGHVAGASKDLVAAAAFYREALSRDPASPELLLRTFLLATAAGSVEEGLTLAQTLARKESNNRFAPLAVAIRALKQGRLAEAQAGFTAASKGPLTDLTGTLLGAWAMQGQGNTDGALAAIDRLTGPDWYDTFKSYHSGLIAEAAGRQEEAALRIGEAYLANKGSVRLIDAYARAQARLGRTEEALKAVGGFESPVGDHPLLREIQAVIESGRKPDPTIRTPAQGAAEALYGLGEAFSRDGLEDLGAVYLQLALYLEPAHPLATFALAELFEDMGQRQRAVEIFDKITRDSPLWRFAQIEAALNLEALDKTQEALQRLELLLEADPTNLEAVTALGNVLRARERFAEAAEAYSRGVALLAKPERRHWSLFYYRGIAYERSKQWAKAEADFIKALELSPDQPLVLNYLGYSWVDQGIHLERALDMIRKAVELRPEDGYIVDSLGWAYYRLRRFEEAVTELERAVELRPQDPVINDHLGDAYQMVGRELEARFQWTRALGLKPEAEDRAKIEAKLKDGLREAPSAANRP